MLSLDRAPIHYFPKNVQTNSEFTIKINENSVLFPKIIKYVCLMNLCYVKKRSKEETCIKKITNTKLLEHFRYVFYKRNVLLVSLI